MCLERRHPMLQDDDIILHLFCAVTDSLGKEDYKHPQGKLYLSEVMLIGILFALKGTSFRRYYKWLLKRKLFEDLPERSRLQRLLITHQERCNQFLDNPTFFTVLDSFGIEVIHPIREGRSKQSQTVSQKGVSNHRWIVGRKLAVTINQALQVVKTSDDTANVSDTIFDKEHALEESITLTDRGFKKKEGTPKTFKICPKGKWNERMVIETLFSLWTRICNAKRSFHRSQEGFKAKMSYLISLSNLVLGLNEKLGFRRLSMVQWAL